MRENGPSGGTPFYLMAAVRPSAPQRYRSGRGRSLDGGEGHRADSCHPSQWDPGNIYLSPLVKSFMRAHPKTEENGCLPSSPEPFHSIPAATVLFMGHNNLSSFLPLFLSVSLLPLSERASPKDQSTQGERDSGRDGRHATPPCQETRPHSRRPTPRIDRSKDVGIPRFLR